MPPREFRAEIVRQVPVMGDASLVTMTAPAGVAAEARGGHFVDILCRGERSYDPLLRRPYSIYRADPEERTITVLVRPYGRGSAWLADRHNRDVVDVLGLLGNTFEVSARSRNMLMVAGGVGAAPLVLLSDWAVAEGLSVTYLMGAMNADGLLPVAELPEEVEYVVATDDGSQGQKGFVTDVAADYLRWADQVFACGPEAMFHSLRRVVMANRIGGKPTVQVSVERTMACGLGACLGCVVETKRGMQASCIDGPVYDMDEVVWS